MPKSNFIYAFLLFVLFSIIYYLGSFSKVPFGDGIGFVTYAEKGDFIFDTNTYAHFLFSNTLVFFQNLFPFVESVTIAKFVVLLSSSFTLVILYKISFELTRHWFSALFCAIIFGFSFSFWKNSEIAEVYTLNIFCISVFVYFAIRFLNENKRHLVLLSSLFLGVSLFSHIQNILMIPAFLLLLYFCRDFRTRLYAFLIFGFLFFILILIPIIQKKPVSGVFSAGVVSDLINVPNILKSFITAMGYLVYNFWYFIPFAFWGMKYLFKHNSKVFLFLIISSVPVFIFGIIFSASDNYVFFIPFNFIFAIFIGLGINSLKEKKWVRIISFSSLIMPVFYLMTFKAVSLTQKGKEFQEKKEYKGGLKYYLLPWMNDNVGILEFTIEKRKAPEPMKWMTDGANVFIKLKKSKGYTLEQIKKL